MTSSRLRFLIAFALVAATLAVYRPVCHYAFVNLDDPDYVPANPLLQAGPLRAFTTIHAGYWIPLTWISYQLDYVLTGPAPGGYHRTNLLLHAANALLLFLLLSRLTGATLPSGFVAALFAFHPLQVESVAWVTERKDVLSTFFGLLTLHAYAAYVERPAVSRYLLVVLWFALSLLAKPMLVTLPCLLLLLDYWPLQRVLSTQYSVLSTQRAETRKPLSNLLLEKLPLFALALAASIVTIFAQRQGNAVRTLREFSVRARLGNAAVSYVEYLGKLVWPFDLAVFYPHPGEALPTWQIAVSLLLLIAITVLVVWRARRQPYLVVGWLWYLGTLFPVSGIMQAGWQGMADRFLYVPSIGLFLLFAFGLRDVFSALGTRRSAFGVGVVLLLLLLLSVRTVDQLPHWRDSLALWEHTRQVTPDNFYARFSHGAALLDAGREDEAAEDFVHSVELKPDHPFGHYQLGLARRKQGRIAEAIACWRRALELAPNYAEAHAAIEETLANLRDKSASTNGSDGRKEAFHAIDDGGSLHKGPG
jgi:tetratricopeptide (TPR) repeat protein